MVFGMVLCYLLSERTLTPRLGPGGSSSQSHPLPESVIPLQGSVRTLCSVHHILDTAVTTKDLGILCTCIYIRLFRWVMCIMKDSPSVTG